MIVTGIICDSCHYYLVWNHNGKMRIIKWAREKGWSIGKQTLCPMCRKKRKSGANHANT